MTWDYRVMRKVEGRGITHWYSYGIYEVYSRPKGWTEVEMCPVGESMDELKTTYELMGEAFEKPVLDHKTGKEIKK